MDRCLLLVAPVPAAAGQLGGGGRWPEGCIASTVSCPGSCTWRVRAATCRAAGRGCLLPPPQRFRSHLRGDGRLRWNGSARRASSCRPPPAPALCPRVRCCCTSGMALQRVGVEPCLSLRRWAWKVVSARVGCEMGRANVISYSSSLFLILLFYLLLSLF